MYADYEANLEPIEESTPNPQNSYAKEINKHIPSGFCIHSKFTYGKVENPLKFYRGEDYVEEYCNYISNEARRLYHMLAKKPMKRLTREQWRKYDRATTCHICLKEFKKITSRLEITAIILGNIENLPI